MWQISRISSDNEPANVASGIGIAGVQIFARLDAALNDRGYLAMGGQIIDAAVAPAAEQRKSEGEKAAIREAKI
jgi:hypothetical protein